MRFPLCLASLLVAVCSVTWAQPPASTDKTLPASLQDAVQDAGKPVADKLWKGLQSVQEDAAPPSLLATVKVLRGFGYGATDSAAAGRGHSHGGGHGGGGGRGAGGGGGHGAPVTPEQTRARFDERDSNRDGVWEGEEINAYMQGQPASNDGKVTFEEYAEAWKQLRARMGGGGNRGNRGGANRGGGDGVRGGRGGHGGSNRGGGEGARGGRGGHQHGPDQLASAATQSDAEFLVSLDVNRDRKLDRAEVGVAVENALLLRLQPWMQQDRDGDGAVSRQEWMAEDAEQSSKNVASPAVTRSPRAFRRLDEDGDDRVPLRDVVSSSADELKIKAAAIALALRWQGIDRNADGRIDASELASVPDGNELLTLEDNESFATEQLYERLCRVLAET